MSDDNVLKQRGLFAFKHLFPKLLKYTVLCAILMLSHPSKANCSGKKSDKTAPLIIHLHMH